MDYGAEQAQEVAALQAIYADDFCFESEVYPPKFCLTLREELCDDAPEVTLLNWSEDVCPKDKEETSTHLLNVIEQNLGTAMIFSLVEVVQSRLVHIANAIRTQSRVMAEAAAQADLEAQIKKGTPMTYEQFAEWKRRFDQENPKCRSNTVVEDKRRRLTGREQFLKDKSLVTSDVFMISDNGDEVVVDETLFEDADVEESSGSEVE
uniref:RWD domain-containing protein n=1 Tax=Trichuris muris TaxID=70415 RepID=A0A5S6R192_TRIMR